MPLAMPIEIGVFWPILRIAGQKNLSPLKIRETLARYPILDELYSVHENPIIIVQRPKTAIKLPVGVLRECYSIAGIIVAGATELLNVRRIHDALHLKGGHPVTRKTTGVFVGENDYLYAKASIASRLNTLSLQCFVIVDFGGSRFDIKHAI